MVSHKVHKGEHKEHKKFLGTLHNTVVFVFFIGGLRGNNYQTSPPPNFLKSTARIENNYLWKQVFKIDE